MGQFGFQMAFLLILVYSSCKVLSLERKKKVLVGVTLGLFLVRKLKFRLKVHTAPTSVAYPQNQLKKKLRGLFKFHTPLKRLLWVSVIFFTLVLHVKFLKEILWSSLQTDCHWPVSLSASYDMIYTLWEDDESWHTDYWLFNLPCTLIGKLYPILILSGPILVW